MAAFTPAPFARLGFASLTLLRLAVLLPLLSGGCAALTSEASLDCEVGTVGCACYGNWTCNYMLSCVDDQCIDKRASTQEPAHDEPQQLERLSDEATLLTNDPLMVKEAPGCVECAEAKCLTSLVQCYETAGCSRLVGCLLRCERAVEGSVSCERECSLAAPLEAKKPAAALRQCLAQDCSHECDASEPR